MVGKCFLFPDHYLLAALTIHYDGEEFVFVVFSLIMF